MSSDSSIYFYNPSLPASIVFTILYVFPAAFLVYTTIIGPRTGKYQHARFFIPVCIGAALEIGGYAIRCASVKDESSIPLYAVSSSLVVIAPVFICASLYLLMGRLVRAGIPDQGKLQRIFGISPRWLPRVFVTSDILSFLTQASGSGIASSGNWVGKEKDIGTNVLIFGLALQLATFSTFLGIVLRFHARAHGTARGVDPNLGRVIVGIYIAGFFILVRCIYRLIEFALGFEGYPFTHEWPLYVFEASPVLIALCALGYFHPGKWLPKSELNAALALQDVSKNRNQTPLV